MRSDVKRGCRYYLTIIDDYSRYLAVYFLRTSDAEEKLRDFVMEVKTTFGRPPKIIRSNSGDEFKNRPLEKFFKQERKNRTLNEMVRCSLQNAGLPKKYWAEAVNTSEHLQN